MRRARGRHHPGIRVRADHALSRPRPGRPVPEGRRTPPPQAAAGGRLGDLRGRPSRGLVFSQGLLRPEAHGRRSQRAAHGEGARDHPVARRDRSLQLLHADLSRGLRTVLVGRLPGRASGDRAAAGLVRLQHLQDVLLVARHRRPALGHLGLEASLPGARLRRDPGAPHQAQEGPARSALAQGTLLAGLLRQDRPRIQASRGGGHDPPAPEGPGGLRAVDPRAAGPVRRARRHLPPDHQHDHRVPLSRLHDGRPAAPEAGQGARTARARGRGNAPHPALFLPDLGHGARHGGPLRRRDAGRRSGDAARPPAGCSTRKSRRSATARRPAPRPSPAAGTSSTPTSGTPTPTTRPRS